MKTIRINNSTYNITSMSDAENILYIQGVTADPFEIFPEIINIEITIDRKNGLTEREVRSIQLTPGTIKYLKEEV